MQYVIVGSRPSLVDDFAENKISEEENSRLVAPFSEEEFKETIWSGDSSKNSGPDGFNFGFLKKFLEVLKDDLFAYDSGVSSKW